jgi:hypothetical protein
VQYQIANAVRFLIGSPPNLLVGQVFKAAFDLWQIVVQQEVSGTIDKCSRDRLLVCLGRSLHCLDLRPPRRHLSREVACVWLCDPQDALLRPAWLVL